VITRFPPEPNGYLHIGHAKAICSTSASPRTTAAGCHLRFDDTNPAKESQEYVDAIMNERPLVGFDWGPHSTTPATLRAALRLARSSFARARPTWTISPAIRSAS